MNHQQQQENHCLKTDNSKGPWVGGGSNTFHLPNLHCRLHIKTCHQNTFKFRHKHKSKNLIKLKHLSLSLSLSRSLSLIYMHICILTGRLATLLHNVSYATQLSRKCSSSSTEPESHAKQIRLCVSYPLYLPISIARSCALTLILANIT